MRPSSSAQASFDLSQDGISERYVLPARVGPRLAAAVRRDEDGAALGEIPKPVKGRRRRRFAAVGQLLGGNAYPMVRDEQTIGARTVVVGRRAHDVRSGHAVNHDRVAAVWNGACFVAAGTGRARAAGTGRPSRAGSASGRTAGGRTASALAASADSARGGTAGALAAGASSAGSSAAQVHSPTTQLLPLLHAVTQSPQCALSD